MDDLTPIRHRELIAWAVGVGVLLAALVGFFGVVRLSTDSYQYFSVAHNIGAGHGFATDIVYYDVELAHGTIPAPITTFPSGFPLAIAAIHATGVSVETAGYLVALLSMVLTTWLVGFGALELGLGVAAARLVLFAFATNAFMIHIARSAVSESLFNVFAIAAVVLAIKTQRRERLHTVASGVAAGVAYGVRYAGILIALGVIAARSAIALFRRTGRSIALVAIAAIGPVLLIGAGIARNVRLAGSWKGGNTKVVHHALRGVAKETVANLYHLFTSDVVSHAALAARAVVAVGVVAGVVRGVGWVRRHPPSPAQWEQLIILAIVAVTYTTGLVYVGTSSVVSYDTRLFLPLLPIGLLLFGFVVRAVLWATPIGRLLTVAGGAAYVALLVLSLGLAQRPAAHTHVIANLQETGADSVSMRAWLDAHLAPHESLLASDGQATAYALDRPVVALGDAEYSDHRWDEPFVLTTMARFGARYLVLYPQAEPGTADVQHESEFLTALLAGAPSTTLVRVASSPHVAIFARRP